MMAAMAKYATATPTLNTSSCCAMRWMEMPMLPTRNHTVTGVSNLLNSTVPTKTVKVSRLGEREREADRQTDRHETTDNDTLLRRNAHALLCHALISIVNAAVDVVEPKQHFGVEVRFVHLAGEGFAPIQPQHLPDVREGRQDDADGGKRAGAPRCNVHKRFRVALSDRDDEGRCGLI